MSVSFAKTGALLKIGSSDSPKKRITDLGETGGTCIKGKPQQLNVPTGLRIARLV